MNSIRKFNHNGFTLVEIMIVCVCLSLLVGPIFLLLRSGSDSSMKGMARIETTLKARRILQQVYADLKMSCYNIPIDQMTTKYFNQIITKEKDGNNNKFEFYSFPVHNKYNEIIEEKANNDGAQIGYRKVNKISYILTGDKKLIRKVVGIDKKVTEKVLAENVNRFNIKECEVLNQSYYFIELCLIDFVHDNKDNNLPQSGDIEPSKNIIVVDFFDVVSPDYWHSKHNEIRPNRNWYVQIEE